MHLHLLHPRKTSEARQKLLNLLRNPQSDTAVVETSWQEYIALYLGFVFNANKSGENSPLRNLIPINWTQSLTGKSTV